MHPELPGLFDQSVEVIKSQGGEVIDNLEFGSREGIGDAEYEVLLYEFKHYLNAYLAGTPDRVKTKTLADLITYNRGNAQQEMPYFKQEIFLMAEDKGPLTEFNYENALEDSNIAMQNVIDDLMKEHDLDLLVLPSRNPANSQDVLNGDHSGGGGTSSYAAVSGYPSITVPMGFIHGLPVSLSFIGSAYSEAQLIEASYAYEQATKVRQKPTFKEYVYE